jgi:ppGpp synthetase/RelA/SpoT-type nucleotidyltranferase
MTEFEIDDNFITENIPVEAMTDDELLKNRDYIYGMYRNKNYLNQIDQEIKDRGLGSPSWQHDDAEYEKQFEVNTSYDQDKEIGSTPSAYFAHSQPMNARNGEEKFKSRDQQQWYYATDQDYLDDEPHENRKVEEAFVELEHPRDNDGKFTSKGGGSSKNYDSISQKVVRKYPQLDKQFVDEQIQQSVELREKATASNKEMQENLKKNLDRVAISGRVKAIDSMVGKLARKPELYATVGDLNDVSGVRVMTSDLDGVFKSLKYIKDNYDVVEEKNNIDVDRDGYRSYHAIIDDGSGVLSEIQIRTESQDVWANYVHDRIYKPKNNKLKNYVNDNKEAITGYIMQMSEYFHNKDKGIEEIKPECPQEIQIELGCME